MKGYNAKAAEEQEATFRTFEDLELYKKARQFRMEMYGTARKLPDFETFELGRQICRAAVSLTSNIAEGHGRYHYFDQIRFQLQARGSLAELIDDSNVCEDEKYLPTSGVAALKKRAKEMQRLIAGYIRYLRSRKSGTSLHINEAPCPPSTNDGFNELCNDSTV